VVFVVTTHDPSTNQTDTAGGFTDLAAAKQCAVETRDMVNTITHGPGSHRIQTFIETWDGGTFTAHRELRNGPNTKNHDEWWLSEAPSFAPIKEN
jgi:hypothetical protein